MGLFFRIIFLGILFFTSIKIHSQQLNIGFQYFAASGRSADLGLEINFSKQFKKNILQVGTEIRSIDWGNHWGLNVSYGRIYYEKKAIKVFGITSIHPGLALFYENFLGSYGLSHVINFRYQSKRRSYIELGLGARYNLSPAYKNYGNNIQFELPLALRWGIQLGKRSNNPL